MNVNFFYVLVLAISFLALFGIAEILYHALHVKPEITRKFVHFSTGVITLLFPIFLKSHWYVLLLCSSFLIILILSLRFDLLPSINKIDRISRGSVSYPISVYGCFYVYTFFNNYIFFYLPILILAISDPLAALFGKRFPLGKYTLNKEQKTLAGSGAFFISALIISALLLGGTTVVPWIGILGGAIVIAVLTTIAEALSQKGYDNVTIPFVALGLLLIGRLLFSDLKIS